MKGNVVLVAFFGVLSIIAVGVIFAVVSLARSDDEAEEISYIDLDDEVEIFDNKLDAYNKQLEDSILSIRDENVKVNLNRLWSKKVKDEDAQNDSLQKLFDEVLEPQAKVPIKPKSKPITQTKSKPAPKPQPITEPEPIEQEKPKYETKDGFYSSFDNNGSDTPNLPGQINAVVHERQKVTTNTTVKLRITERVIINGVEIPSGTFVKGKASLSNERVSIKFESILYNGKFYPFNYSVYDPDGWKGILVPDLIINDAAQQTVNEATRNANARVNVPIVGSVAFNTANKANNEASAIIVQDYPVILKLN